MNRSFVPLRHVATRGFSTIPARRLWKRLPSWPLVKKPEPVTYRLQMQQPRLHGTKVAARRTIRILIGVAIVYYFLPFSIEIGSTEDEKDGMVNEGSTDVEGDEDEDSGLFLPLTWPVELERSFYKGSDPEWQEYMKFARDKEAQKRAHQAVVMHCRQAFIDVPELARAIGKVNVSKGKYWLDVDFPPGPPPDYEQIGLEITSSFVALAAQTLSQQEYNQLSRYFDVKAAFLAVQATAMALAFNANKLLNKVLTSDNIEGPQPNPEPTGRLPRGTTRIGPVGTMGPIGSLGQGSIPKASGLEGSSSQANVQPDNKQRNSGTGEVDEDDNSQRDVKEVHQAQQMIRKFFAIPFSQQMEAAPPRGSVLLGGLVECHGSHFVATVDVVAAWDLSEEQIVMHNTKIRHITPRRIAPRGGSRMPPHGPHGPAGPPMM